MGKTGPTLALLAATAAVLACAALLRDNPIDRVRTPDLRPSPVVAGTPAPANDPAAPQRRIGDFERVKNAPDYEILEQSRNGRDGARGALLLVDTRSRDLADFTLITRDVKARYGGLDAVTLRFVDSRTVLDYNGSAVIFNTAAGAYYAGYAWGPPNAEGYLVDVTD